MLSDKISLKQARKELVELTETFKHRAKRLRALIRVLESETTEPQGSQPNETQDPTPAG